MEFPSKEVPSAARPLLRPRGAGGAGRLRQQLSLLLRSRPWESRRRGRSATPDPHARSPHAEVRVVTPPESMMHRPPSPGFRVAVDEEGPRGLILEGELDAGSAPTLETAIAEYCADSPRSLTLDLGGLTFIDSSALWTLLAAMRWCEQHGRGFSLLPGPGAVQEVFEVTGLIDVLPFRTADTLV